jgi:inorganic pyrophosphatase
MHSISFSPLLQVKVLGVLAMIDDGELDWKVIAINSEDPLAAKLNDIGDVETNCPGVVSGT